ncbi:MAG: histidine kinase dimerization/phosphoacceptor domain -containing protein, partial [Spirochaetota bacterium]
MHRIFVVGFDSQRKKRLLAGLDQAGHSAVSVIDLGTWLEREWQDGSLIVVLDVGPVMTHLSESAVPIVVAPSGVSEQTVLALVDSALGSRPTAEPLRYEDTIVRELLATSPDHISFKDLNGRFVRISASLVPVFGLDRPEDAIGKSDFDFYPEEQARAFFEEEQCMIRGGPPVINRLADYLHPDGSVVRGLVTKMPLRDAEGTVIGTYGVARNVTELLEAESRIRALLDEKEILLREIHHRVKNDFSLIRSLLLLEASQSPHNEVVAALRDAASRVAVMARTYDQINVRGNPASVAVRPLVEELFRDGVEAAAVPLSVHTSIDD